jgi:biotin carboxyl carrier protein
LAYPGFRNVRACPQRIDFGFDGGDDLAVVYEFTAAHAGRIEVRRGGPEVSWTGPVAGSSFRAEVAADECLEYEAVGKLAIERQIVVELDGLRRQFTFDRNGDHIVVSDRTNAVTFRVLPRFADTSASAVEGALESPVPGTVVAVEVAAGDQVAEGQTLVVMEAMKMEHRIVAQAAGVISEIRVNVGQSVDAHEVLVVVE